ncbi:MAG TPA: hypothetical protein VE595_02045 [Nitrososphaeraceae archaeon]|nr:hypothetical protein [Nitrososphaeraceae archaeon]
MNVLLDEHRYGFGGSRADRGSKKRLNVSRNRLTLKLSVIMGQWDVKQIYHKCWSLSKFFYLFESYINWIE